MKCKFFNFFFVACVFSFLSCRDKNDCAKNGCPPEYTRFELGEALPYLWAKPGSYWIYKHSQTGVLDTHTVTGFLYDSVTVKGTEDHSQHRTFEYDVLGRVIYSSYNEWNFYDRTSYFNPNSPPSKGLFYGLEHEASGGVIFSFYYPFNFHDPNSDTTTKFFRVDDIFTLQGNTFHNVVQFDVSVDDIQEKDCIYKPITRYYWAQGVGLIKKDVKNCGGYSWELIEFSIIE